MEQILIDHDSMHKFTRLMSKVKKNYYTTLASENITNPSQTKAEGKFPDTFKIAHVTPLLKNLH